LSMHEVGEASTLVQESVGDSANVIFGMVVDEQLTDELRVTVIATGFNHEAQQAQQLQKPKEIPRSEFGAADFSELDKPTFKREHKNVDVEYPSTSRQNIFTFPSTEEEDVPEGVDDLDIPTFLRKQMD